MSATALLSVLETLPPPTLDALLTAIQQLRPSGVTPPSPARLSLEGATAQRPFRAVLGASPRSSASLVGAVLTADTVWLNARGPKGGLYLYAPNASLRHVDGTVESVDLRISPKYWEQLTKGTPVDAYVFRAGKTTSENIGSLTQFAQL